MHVQNSIYHSLLYRDTLTLRLRMPLSSFGLMCFVILLLLFSQGCPQCFIPRPRSLGHVKVSCCTEVGNGTINEPVNECFEQKETRFHHCRVHAFIFTKGTKRWCVDPKAWWLQQRFRRLQSNGICCQIL
uniref:Chemokine interleukin-8-like domain-containing protein n=1 Tax=Acanthochromis polyacanthus TaxID=80966 RepID=A0A3Q1F7U6_9TELE